LGQKEALSYKAGSSLWQWRKRRYKKWGYAILLPWVGPNKWRAPSTI